MPEGGAECLQLKGPPIMALAFRLTVMASTISLTGTSLGGLEVYMLRRPLTASLT